MVRNVAILAITGALLLACANRSRAEHNFFQYVCDPDSCQTAGDCEDCEAAEVVPFCMTGRFSCDRSWYVLADAIFLTREDPTSGPLLVGTAGNGVVGSAEMVFENPLVPQVTVGRQFNPDWALEAGYLGSDGFDADTQWGPLTDPAFLAGSTGIATDLSGAGRATYGSEFHSGEINARYYLGPRFSALVGFRYLYLDEDFSLFASDGMGTTAMVEHDTLNRLYGFQMGAEWIPFAIGRMRGEGLFKAGVYQNDAEHFGRALEAGVGTAFSEETQSTAFVGEIRLKLVWQINQTFALRTGWEALWLEGVALASDQVAVANFPAGGGTDFQGGTFYNGFLAGVEANW